MNKFILVILVLFFVPTARLLAQSDSISNESANNYEVYGLFDYGSNRFLITDQGLIREKSQSDINDDYLKYYLEIYGDSTIQNPNLILEDNNFDERILIYPLIDLSKWQTGKIRLNDKTFLLDFLEKDTHGNVYLNSEVKQFLPD